MQIYQHFREDIFSNINVCRIIYKMEDPQTLLFKLTPLVFVILTKVISYILLTVFTLAVLYYTINIACLIDNVCYAQNYEVIR